WGLAGLRFGFAAASEDVVRALKKISEPYGVSALKRAVVLRALSLYSYVERSVEETRSVRNYMFDRMADIEGVQPYPSDANFILFRVGDSAAVKEGLAREGFLVRDVSDKPLLENCLRVTVPPRLIAEKFLDVLEKVSSTAGRRDL
ncbi:MAG: histidinol-phosphate aminotransferase family protein, partial [Thermoprotei archaeon]